MYLTGADPDKFIARDSCRSGKRFASRFSSITFCTYKEKLWLSRAKTEKQSVKLFNILDRIINKTGKYIEKRIACPIISVNEDLKTNV